MGSKFYEIQLRRGGYKTRLDVFTRSLDLDDERIHDATDGLLRKLLVSAIEAEGGKLDDIAHYDLQLFERGQGRSALTFRMARDEL